MKNLSLFFFCCGMVFCGVLMSCTQKNQSDTSNHSETTQDKAPKAANQPFRFIDSSRKESLVTYEGIIKKRVHWSDAEGEKVFIVSYYEKGTFFSDGYLSYINTYFYTIKDGKTENFPEHTFKNLQMAENLMFRSLQIGDDDKDNLGEIYMTYSACVDGLDPDMLNTLVFNKHDLQGRIYGTIPKTNEDIRQFKKYTDKSFSTLPEAIKKKSVKEWEKIAKKDMLDLI